MTNCKMLQIKLRKTSPENIENFFDFLPEAFIDKVISNEELSDKEKYILLIYKIAETFDCNFLDLYISLIAKQSDNLEKCVIDSNEKIFNALKLLIKTLKKAGFSQTLFNSVINQNSFVSKALKKLQENYEEELKTYEIDDIDEELLEEKEKVKTEFKEKYDSIIQEILSFTENKKDNAFTQPTIDLSLFTEKISFLENEIQNIPQQIEEVIKDTLNTISLSSEIGEKSINFNSKELEDSLRIIKENLKTIETRVVEGVAEVLNKKLEPIVKIEESLNDFVNKISEKIDKTISDLEITTDSMKSWDLTINDIKRDIKNISDSVIENAKNIEKIDKTISEEIKKADAIYNEKCATKKK